MESLVVKSLRFQLSKTLKNCKNNSDLEWFRNQLVQKLLSNEYSIDAQYRIKYYLLLTDFRLKRYNAVEESISYEDLTMTNYFKVHKFINIKFYMIVCIFFSIIQIGIIINSYVSLPYDLFFLSLLIIPLLIVAVSCEYCSVRISELFPIFVKQILSKDCIIRDIRYRSYYLINLFDVKAFREARMAHDNYVEHKTTRVLLLIGISIFFVYSFQNYIFFSIMLSFAVWLTFYSFYRFKIGGMAAMNINTILPNKIKYNLYAFDKSGGSKVLLRVFGYTIFSFVVQILFLITIILVSLKVSNINENDIKSHVLKLIIYIIAFGSLFPFIDSIKAFCKGIFILRFQKILRNRLYSKLLYQVKQNEDSNKLVIDFIVWNNSVISGWEYFKRTSSQFAKFFIFILPILLGLWATAYPAEIRLQIDILWNYFFK